MPSKKKKQILPQPKCTLSSRHLLETVPIQDLGQSAVVSVPSSKQVNEPSPSESGSCDCDEGIYAPGTCGALDTKSEESYTLRPEQKLKTPTCVPNCQATELEAMIDEIRNCRQIIRTLALEAMDILHPENSQQNKQNFQAQQGPITNGKVFCFEHDDNSEANPIGPAPQANPIDLRQNTDCSKKKCEISEPRKYSDLEGQSTTRLFAKPTTLLKSPVLSRKSSGRIAQTACHIKNKRLGQEVVRKKPSNCSCDGEKKKADCGCDETMDNKTLGLKPSECSCNEDKKKNCRCDETMKKQNKENERRENTDSKTLLQKTLGWINSDTSCPVVVDDCVCDDEEMEKQNKSNSLKDKRKVATACAMPNCAANTCTCHFPPAYSQYFKCTGNVSGNCHCDKNA